MSSFRVIPGVASPAGAPVIPFAQVSPVLPPVGAYKDLISRLGTVLSTERDVRLRAAFTTLQSAGLLSVLDVVAGGLASAADSRMNWLGSQYGATIAGAPAWSESMGWTFDGADDHLLTGYTPSTAGGNFGLNSASISIVVTNTGPNATTYAIGTAGAGSYARILARAGTVSARLNTAVGTDLVTVSGDATGVWTVNRVDHNTVRLLHNGELLIEDTDGVDSVQLSVAQLALARDNTTYFAGAVKAWAIGGGLSAAQEQAITQALSAL